MNTYPYLCDYICYLEKTVKKLHTKNKRLEKKAGKQIRINRMEYKIHELHVKTLSGTMNLGLTAQADENAMGDIVNQLTKTGNFNFSVGEQEETVEQPEQQTHATSPIQITPDSPSQQ